MGRLKILVISYLVFFTLLATTCYVILYLFHPIYEPTIGDPIGSMWLARMMYKGEIGDCEGLTCSYGGVKVYFGENE
ncbi:MAG: hypothetical protein OWQ48_02465 [Desulfurococcus sp.]|nr:hypothetical protein [Desulfurococcus sp.]